MQREKSFRVLAFYHSVSLDNYTIPATLLVNKPQRDSQHSNLLRCGKNSERPTEHRMRTHFEFFWRAGFLCSSEIMIYSWFFDFLFG